MPKKRSNDVTDDQIVAAYEQSHSIFAVADSLQIGSSTVLRVLQKREIPRVGLSEYRGTMGRPKTVSYVGVYSGSTEELLEWYSSGMSMRAIAKRIGRSVHVVGRAVRKANIARPHGVEAYGEHASGWKGGRVEAGQGYWRVWVSDDDPMVSMRDHSGYVKEHRLVLARKLGRPLLATETVHHIDGKRSNNTPENLQLRQGKHGNNIAMCCLVCGSQNVGPAPLGEH